MALRKLPVFFCAECGNPEHRTQPSKIFCSATCRQAQWNRRVNGGYKLYELAMSWRIERPKGAIARLGAAVDQLAAEERVMRARRAKIIAAHKAAGVTGDLPPDFEHDARSASLSTDQKSAMADAGIFTLAFAAGRIPNDPEQLPSNWPAEKLAAIEAAVSVLGGMVDASRELEDA